MSINKNKFNSPFLNIILHFKNSKLYSILSDKLQNRINVKFEKLLYKNFRNNLNQMKLISNYLKPVKREDCFDRYYIDNYVKLNKEYIKKDVLEFAGGDISYAKRYGQNVNVKFIAYIGHKDIYSDADYFCDLDDAETLPDKKFDCIIATQVIMYTKNVEKALKNLKYMLKPNGRLILTVPGPLFHHSKNSHHMFSFTEESLKYMVSKVFNNYDKFEYYGNLEYVQFMLHWMKKCSYEYPHNQDYMYTLVMGISTNNKEK